MTIQIGFKLYNYKSFKKNGVTLQTIKPINIIIGKNNIGKSSFIDALDHICTGDKVSKDLTNNIEITIPLEQKFQKYLNQANIEESNSENTNEETSETQSINYKVTYRTSSTSDKTLVSTIPSCSADKLAYLSRYIHDIRTNEAYYHIRLSAERDISPEADTDKLSLSSKGVGATQIIHALLHHLHKPHKLITKTLLEALNEIFNGDLIFSQINSKLHRGDDLWEIFLAQETHELHSLSDSGSGLKTIILVLLNLLIRPIIEKKSTEQYIFSFEELENNLHPSLQRQLFIYLEKFAISNKCHIFITSHSNIAIDVFSASENAQILHIFRQDDEVVGSVFDSTSHGYSILHDLGVTASDILQSNGIIWVEGPSDRIFINKFIEIWSKQTLREGAHYQFAFYGGSVLANLDASTPESKFDEVMSVLRINRNVIFVCDSDKKNASSALKPRVEQLKRQLDINSGLCWITDTREIENYVPKEAFGAVHNCKITDEIGEFEYVQDYLKNLGISQATEYRDKVKKATLYSEHFTKENLGFRKDLDNILIRICSHIRRWNHIKSA